MPWRPLRQVLRLETRNGFDAAGREEFAEGLRDYEDDQGEDQVSRHPSHDSCLWRHDVAPREVRILQAHDDAVHSGGEEPDLRTWSPETQKLAASHPKPRTILLCQSMR